MRHLKKSITILLSIMLIMSLFSIATAAKPSPYEPTVDDIQVGTFEYDGYQRTFKYYVPTTYNESKNPVPLMLSFHGRGSSGSGQIRLSSFQNVAEKEGFIVVFPDSTEIDDGQLISPGHRFQWNDGRTNTPQYRAGVDDVSFTSELIDHFQENFNIDPSRVYASGMSNGSLFANRLAVELSDRIAGIGAVTGPLAAPIAEKTPKGPVKVVLFMGTDDPVVNYHGIPDYLLSAEETVDYWVNANGTVTKPRIYELPQTGEEYPGQTTKVIRHVYSGGKHGTEVVFYKLQGAGHVWPGGLYYSTPEYIGYPTNHINASQVIWDELKTHSLPGAKSQGKLKQVK
jgi:polyhydroxybutyrate depolymerase